MGKVEIVGKCGVRGESIDKSIVYSCVQNLVLLVHYFV